MARRKKTFACGHRGYGKVCHRCLQVEQERESKRQQKNEWESTFEQDPVDLRSLPKNVVLKARQILERLQGEKDYRTFRGKRMRHNRLVISIPVTRNYRLLCRDQGSNLVPEAVISHEEYNACKPGA